MQFVLFVLLKNETDFNTLKIFNKKYIVCLYKKGVVCKEYFRTCMKTKHIKPLICLVVNVAYGVNCQQIYPKWTNNASTLQCVCTNIMYCNAVELFSKTNHTI